MMCPHCGKPVVEKESEMPVESPEMSAQEEAIERLLMGPESNDDIGGKIEIIIAQKKKKPNEEQA